MGESFCHFCSPYVGDFCMKYCRRRERAWGSWVGGVRGVLLAAAMMKGRSAGALLSPCSSSGCMSAAGCRLTLQLSGHALVEHIS